MSVRWPERARVGPFRAGAFTSPLHDERTAAILGVALGVAFTTCFATGLLSHLIQHPPGWFTWPSRPAGLYRITQGLHVATGIAAVPLLLGKLWTVYPRLFTWPPVRHPGHALERLSLLFLVGGAVFMLFSGVANIDQWYPWGFFFPAGHYWGAWITIGALVVHVGAKAGITRSALFGPRVEAARAGDGLTRRGFLGALAAAAGVLTLTTAGQTVSPLRRLTLLSPRRPDIGPQGLPVNKSAAAAGVLEAARDPAYRLVVAGAVDRPMSLALDDLRALPQHEVTLPIACVEGWSASARWKGVRMADVLARAGARPGARVRVESLQPRGRYRAADVSDDHARDADTLLALELNGEPLALDHGYPVRLIGPNRPGVLQTKWISRLTVT
ncbi:MAG: molybdopterin-dependent oxidoreductase [Acidimicrobiia bacterium]